MDISSYFVATKSNTVGENTMLSRKEMDEHFQEQMLCEVAKACCYKDGIYPNKFIEKMRSNKGMISLITTGKPAYPNLEPRNPLVVIIGDSITAGFFEEGNEEDSLSFAQDLSQCYVDKFKYALHEEYGITSVNVINSGIAGDTIEGMNRRLDRDVLSYHPDLVIFNGSMNWSINHGDEHGYETQLRALVERVKQESTAELILMTPNKAVITDLDPGLAKRVYVIRKIAKEYKVSLADVYGVWEKVVEDEAMLINMLSNGRNHPTPFAHTIMSLMLLNLCKIRKES